jgi:D-arabinose 5-phosphate isomerase GutQ
VAAVTADPQSTLGKEADAVLVIPGSVKTGAGIDSEQMRGSAFEQSAFITLEAIVLLLGSILGESEKTMRHRHTNLE